ncbi:MAG: HD domain-containing protein [Chloroflexi bacterium]|nr:HD domain-containing protein [Chloroflexota bacterium]
MRGARYRLWQFWRLITQRLSPDELTQVREWLPPSLFDVFRQMSPAEQHHAYSVRHTLAAQGQTNPDLLAAALLHDVGKSRMPLAVWEKVAIVLGFRFAKRLATAWGSREGGSRWRRPFVVAMQHPAWGAEMVNAAGGSPTLVELIRRHQDRITPTEDLYDLLSALQSADNSN